MPNWLTQVGEEGDEVVVVLEAGNRWLFEPLPGAQWRTLDDGRHAVKFRVSEARFLDSLMLRAGPGAVVVTEKYARRATNSRRRSPRSSRRPLGPERGCPCFESMPRRSNDVTYFTQ